MTRAKPRPFARATPARASDSATAAPPLRALPGLQAHVLLSLATVATFARAVPYPLQVNWDDGRFIVDNPDAHEVSMRALRSIFGAPHFQAYHPLHLLSYWLDVPWAGADGPVLHAVSLAIWLLGVNVLLRVFAHLGLSVVAAMIAAMAFALHPVQVEAVSWATGRKDALALLFSAACMLAHLRSRHGLDRHAWLARGAFVLAALSKTTSLPLPAVLVACDVLLRRISLRRALSVQLPSILLALGLGAATVQIWSEQNMLRAPDVAGPLFARVAASYAHALGTALWPSAVSPLYSERAASAGAVWPWIACALLAGAALLAYRRRAFSALFALAAFTFWMLPVSNLLPMYFPYQDRYLSLPLIGLCFGLGSALDAARASGYADGRVAGALAAAAVVALGLRTFQYEGEWSSEQRLWGHAASTQPGAYYAWMKLGEVRRKHDDLYGAIRAYQRLPALDPKRKLGPTALFEAVALRDEALHAITPSHAEPLAREYFAALDNAEDLRVLAGRMLGAGYARAYELPMARSIQLAPLSDEALEHVALVQFEQGRPMVGLFYLEHMQKPTQRPDLQEQAELARKLRGNAPVL
jgi:hypothetical protein